MYYCSTVAAGLGIIRLADPSTGHQSILVIKVVWSPRVTKLCSVSLSMSNQPIADVHVSTMLIAQTRAIRVATLCTKQRLDPCNLWCHCCLTHWLPKGVGRKKSDDCAFSPRLARGPGLYLGTLTAYHRRLLSRVLSRSAPLCTLTVEIPTDEPGGRRDALLSTQHEPPSHRCIAPCSPIASTLAFAPPPYCSFNPSQDKS